MRSARFRTIYKQFFWLFFIDCLILGYVGSQAAEEPLITIGQIATAYYFAHFLVIVPLVSLLEKPKPVPESISAAVTGGEKE